MKYARKKHKLHLLADISSSERTIKDVKEKGNVPTELSKLLPPRRSWYRPNPTERKRFSDSQELQEYSILKTIFTIHLKVKNKSILPPLWYVELDLFIKKIQNRINNPHIESLKTPQTKPIKKENTRTCKECRPISLFELEDRLIISLTAKYFTNTFDHCFHDCSFAFRASAIVENKKTNRTHHDTITEISKFLNIHKEENIYVSECDIQKFFDCVNHELVTNALLSITQKFDLHVNENALAIFTQYLNSYSFSKDVYPLNETDYFRTHNLNGAKFKWTLDELKREFYTSEEYSPTLDNTNIGVPQGGALSCFISNLLLHSVDDAVSNCKDPNLLYLRFCDDMVILHTNKNDCEKALQRYESAIQDLKLLIHKPHEITNYSRSFWKTKSKKPYKWGSKSGHKSNVPWLSFVGYQIKFDGSIRIRKKSLEKEKKKQKEECIQILKALNHFQSADKLNETSKKSKRQQLFALENRLISMSVGRVRLYEKDKRNILCWTNGFKALNLNKTAIKQLKLLDKSRTKHLYDVKKQLKKLQKQSAKPDTGMGKKFFGSPYSYHDIMVRMSNSAKK